MKNKNIYWKSAIELIKAGKKIEQSEINFNKEHINIDDVKFFNKHKIKVPESLIFYDDENIDCSEIPEITKKDIISGKIQWFKIDEIPLDNEVRTWIIKQNIKLNELVPQLIQNFYQTMKSIRKNAAL
ncbi:MAG: hypothetical protein A2046_10850 [Bacteroidetes bacterium GWA2_30_7]|nr:MAG: hypothetical protein A2046_10850 [Bacteroidetes bacterium GWA2_30_7]